MKKKINQTINWKEQSFRYAKKVESNGDPLFEKHFSFFLIKRLEICSMLVVEMEFFK